MMMMVTTCGLRSHAIDIADSERLDSIGYLWRSGFEVNRNAFTLESHIWPTTHSSSENGIYIHPKNMINDAKATSCIMVCIWMNLNSRYVHVLVKRNDGDEWRMSKVAGSNSLQAICGVGWNCKSHAYPLSSNCL